MTRIPDLTVVCGGCTAERGQPCDPYCPYETGDPTNSDRAESGIVAINAYVNDAYMVDNRDLSRDDDLDQAARDLIGDVFHRLDRARVHPGVILRQAYNRYREEALTDNPGDRPTVAYAAACGYCGAERDQPCYWACESWGLSEQNRHTEPALHTPTDL
ncbi:hypothetical protein ACQP2T_61625 [Nonomuraea sp. CA-143628]|uniref:hypothetical protein n=1 Tax=Nonomuraea sp. CA-143628 TaxID=3239997 RepID=UPI003D8DE7BD